MKEYRSLHIALCTINYNKKVSDFFIQTKEKLYDSYITNYNNILNEKLKKDELYHPSAYIMFGSYDVSFVSLIHDFEFAQENFFPVSKSNDFFDTKYQIITGIPTHDITVEKLNQKKYIAIINLKIKNGLLIGNGNALFNNIVTYLKDKFEDRLPNRDKDEHNYVNSFIITQSFSWFEISVTLFDDDLSKLMKTIASIRNIKLQDVFIDNEKLKEIIQNSYYDTTEDDAINFNTKNIFSDTQSHLGINKETIDNYSDKIDESLSSEEISKNLELPKLNFLFEWQIKPGTFNELKEVLEKKNIKTPDIHQHFLSGKYDYISEIVKEYGLIEFIKIYKLINNSDEFHNIVRQIKSRPLLDTLKWDNKIKDPKNTDSITTKLSHFTIKGEDIENIDKKLKTLKLSRLLRKKVIKIFENYNIAITEPVLFLFFIDFCIFIKFLKKRIENFEISAKDNPIKVFELTQELEDYINAFEDAYHARYLNSYNYEEINTFDLDFNSSIEQLLTAYNTLTTQLSQQYYNIENSNRIVLFNLNATHSKGMYVNFFINHILNPEFVYQVFIKEILNSYMSINEDLGRKKEYDDIVSEITKSDLKKFFNSKNETKSYLEVFKYLVTDLIHFESYRLFIINKLGNPDAADNVEIFKNYNYWFWTHCLQSSLLYNTDGIINRKEFQIQLCRILILMRNVLSDDFEEGLHIIEQSLLPELFSYWHREIESLKEIILNSSTTLTKIIVFQKKLSKEHENNYNKNINNSFKEYLYKLAEKSNNFSPQLLRRNWSDGTVMPCFLNHSEDYYYYVDPFGGTFFDNFEIQKEYIIIRNKELKKIWHNSLVYKKQLLENELKELFNKN